MLTYRPGGYKWRQLIEKMKKGEKYCIERQRILDEAKALKETIASQTIRFNS